MNIIVTMLFCFETAIMPLAQAVPAVQSVEAPKPPQVQRDGAAPPAEAPPPQAPQDSGAPQASPGGEPAKPGDALPPGGDLFDLDPDAAPKPPSDAAVAAQAMIDTALKQIQPGVERRGNSWQIALGERSALIITDPLAERMRIMVPIIEAETVDEATLRRMMQANFDSALDARYAIAQGVIWGTYIHPLTSLTERDFISGLAQSFKIAENFGTTYSSDVFVFGGGDSNAIFDDLQKRLKELEEDSSQNTV